MPGQFERRSRSSKRRFRTSKEMFADGGAAPAACLTPWSMFALGMVEMVHHFLLRRRVETSQSKAFLMISHLDWKTTHS